ncbi:glycosyltransferase family 4 protein [Sphingobacterium faecium]|uniref:glycosyltransferase family 4 protein n=1 Tax=Sphingobacterium faecium TaxID=34087 RepID=UPI0024693EE3|nr:glycosyltransferase family 4 protein [Sphingobacterium faecium]MDH5828701.1 glycosyltransferase family 4 protein [Sphingobacterium faecium]
MSKVRLIRITTVPISLKLLLKGQHDFMKNKGFDVLGVSSSGKELDEVKHDEQIPVHTLEMTRMISPLQDLKSLWAFYWLCKKVKPTIVHSHTPKAGIVSMLGARLAGVPIRLHTVAGMPLMEAAGIKRVILDWVEKLTYGAATGVYPNSKGLYDFIVQHQYTNNEKLKVIGNGSSNGIDTSFFSREELKEVDLNKLRMSLNINENDFVFIFVGRLVSDKGINELVEAFKVLGNTSKVDRNIKLLLVGPLETALDPLLDVTLKDIQANPNIISVGFQKDVRPYFAISDALVFPSYREGFPNVVMQAGAMGLPAIVSDINGCNEIIVEGQNGTIIPVKNSVAIQKTMERLLIDKGFYFSLKQNARKMICERYEQQVVWDALLTEYKQLLKDKGLDN